MGVHTSYGLLFAGNIAAAVVGLILELFFFAVDYAKSENLQFEDDEYYYYVKAVPKLSVPAKEKQIKRINKREETEELDAVQGKREVKKEPPSSTMQLTGDIDIDKLIEEELMK